MTSSRRPFCPSRQGRLIMDQFRRLWAVRSSRSRRAGAATHQGLHTRTYPGPDEQTTNARMLPVRQAWGNPIVELYSARLGVEDPYRRDARSVQRGERRCGAERTRPRMRDVRTVRYESGRLLGQRTGATRRRPGRVATRPVDADASTFRAISSASSPATIPPLAASIARARLSDRATLTSATVTVQTLSLRSATQARPASVNLNLPSIWRSGEPSRFRSASSPSRAERSTS